MAVVVSSSSSFSSSYKYDVFISFRGQDTRNNFTSYLYDALRENQIETFIDEESLKKGERISELLTAIEESRLSLIVFSKDYSASRWCLDELVKLLECKKRGQIVIPIFYHVDPTNIRHQRESYGDAFVEHQKRYHIKKVEEWRNALKEAADLSGFHLLQDHHSESKFVKKIVEDVLERLYNFPSRNVVDDFQGLVGIRERLQKIESLLSVGSLDVRIIGIWGMGGIGKTTLAQALYKRLSSQFESCFFTNVKDDVSKHGLDSLMEKMFCKLLKRESVAMDSDFKDYQLRRRKVLVVLDNVDELQQLECLFGEHDVYQRCFGVGSRIIITSRDKKLLMSRADEIHEVDALDSNEARRLFYMKAFKRDSAISTTYKDLAERVLDYAKGNPLALKVLGSHLQSRSIKEWESAMSKLKRGPNETIQNVLKMSYDALDRIEKSIFLDIACFFKWKDRDFMEGILGEESHIGINVLVEKSLITIDDRETIGMHDLIQEMGWEIVRQESRNEIAERSRLWDAQDVFHVLENNKGTKHIEGLFLDMSKIDEDLCLEPTVFEAMSNLRLLKIYHPYHNNKKKFKVYLHQGLRYLPNSLRYLNWSNCPLKTLPTKFRPESLVELEMPFSQLKQLWDGVQLLGNLKRIDLSFSQQLVKIPDLSHASRLVSVDLEGCKSLVEIPPLNFQNFDQRVFGFLNLSFCTNLTILPEISGNVRNLRLRWSGIKELPSSIRSLENLFYLDVTCCENLEKLSELPRNIKILELGKTSIREIPVASIDCLHRVKEIHMHDCKRLESLPSNIFKLKALRQLHLNGCSNLKHLPQILPTENLPSLYLRGTGIREFPSPIENIMGPFVLNMYGCRNLETIPKCHSKLSFLGLHSLEEVHLGYCRIFEVPCWIGDLSSLTRINLKGNMFTSIPSSIKKLSNLTYLDISHCQNLLSVPELPLSLRQLHTIGCTSMETVSASSLSPIFIPKDFWSNFLGIDFEFLFCECLKLDENSVAMNFLCKLLGIRVILKELKYHSIKACYPGKEIPKWMRHQSEGSSTVTIKLPPNWHSSNFFGVVTCVVLSFEELYWCKNFDDGYVRIFCELHVKTKYGRGYNCVSSELTLKKQAFGPEDGQEEGEMLRSDHVFMWHDMYRGHYYVDAVEMSFVFSCEGGKHTDHEYCSFKCQVKRCGAHMLYIEEEVINEFDMSIQQYVEYMVEAEERGISILQCMNNSKECDQPMRTRPRLGDSIRGGLAFGGELHPKSGDMTSLVNLGVHDGRAECPLPLVSSTSSLQQSFSQSTLQLAPVSQQISPLHMPIQSPQQLLPFVQLHPKTPASYSQSHPPLSSLQQLIQLHYSLGQPAISQPLPSQQLVCSNRRLPISQPRVQYSVSSAISLQSPLNINLQPLPAAPIQQQLHPQQSPSQLSQMLSQQKQALRASFQSSRQAFFQLQQQLGLMQPSSSQDTKQQQQQWAGTAAQAVTRFPATIASADVPSSSTSVAPAIPVKCPWTEHFSLDGCKYYYNNVTGEGKWEKPEELILYEQQQQQKTTVLQNQSQSLHQRSTAQQVLQTRQIQFQTQFQMQAQQQFQQAPSSLIIPPDAWLPMSPPNLGPMATANIHGFRGQFHPRFGDMTLPINLGGHRRPADSPLLAESSSSTLQQSFSQPMPQIAPGGQQLSPLQKPIQSPQQLAPSLQLHPQTSASYSQAKPPPLASLQQLCQTQLPYSSGQTAIRQALSSQHLLVFNGHQPISQPQVQNSMAPATALRSPPSINLQPLPAAPVQQQQQLQPLQQSPSQLAQMLSQKKQALQASFQSTWQAFSQLQQQLQLMQPSDQGGVLQQGCQDTKQQQWGGTASQAVTSLPATTASADVPSSTSTAPAVPVKCPWTEHISPDGYKYYYNSITGESKWEKPEELILSEQQQQQQQQQQKATVLQRQSQSLPQLPTAQQVSQTPEIQRQSQFQLQAQQQFQQPSLSSTGYAQLQGLASSGQQAAQDWMWKNNQAGSGRASRRVKFGRSKYEW